VGARTDQQTAREINALTGNLQEQRNKETLYRGQIEQLQQDLKTVIDQVHRYEKMAVETAESRKAEELRLKEEVQRAERERWVEQIKALEKRKGRSPENF